MNSKSISVSLFIIFIISGCGMKGVPRQGVSSKYVNMEMTTAVFPPSNEPSRTAAYSDALTQDSLKNSGYIKLGFIDMGFLERGCFGSSCSTYMGKVNATGLLVEEAAKRGGTLVVLTKDNARYQASIFKDSTECETKERFGSRGVVYKNYSYGTVREDTVASYDYCTKWKSIRGQGDWVSSVADVWRYDPDLVRKIKEADRTLGLKIVTYTSPRKWGESEFTQCAYADPVLGTVLTKYFNECHAFDPRGGDGIGPGYAYAMEHDVESKEVSGKYVYTRYKIWYRVDRHGKVTLFKKEREDK